MAADYTKVSMTPGKDESELNFAWYSKADGKDTPRGAFRHQRRQHENLHRRFC